MGNGLYSPVPRALESTRRTLRDIMTDMADTTVQDAKLDLALKSQKGTLEIEKLEGEADLAKLKFDDDFRKSQLAETAKHHRAMEGIGRAKAGVEALGQKDTMRNWINKFPGLSSAMKGIATKNLPDEELDQIMTGKEAKQMFEMISKNPGFYYRNLKGVVIDKLERLMGQLQDPESGLSEDQVKQIYAEQYAPLHQQLKQLDTVLGTSQEIKPEDMEEIRKMAMEYVEAGDGTVALPEATTTVLEAFKQIRKAVYGSKGFPKSLKELIGEPGGVEPGGVEPGGGGSARDYGPPAKTKGKETKGMVTPGNIDLTNRTVVKNEDGTVSTERSISIGTEQGEVLIPTVINGKVVSKDEAIKHYKKTGQHLGIFEDAKSATDYADTIHKRKINKKPALGDVTRVDRKWSGYKQIKSFLGEVAEKGRIGRKRMTGIYE